MGKDTHLREEVTLESNASWQFVTLVVKCKLSVSSKYMKNLKDPAYCFYK